MTAPITSAVLDLHDPIFGYESSDPSEDLGIFQVATDLADLTGGAGGTATYDDLGTGTLFGTTTLTDAINSGGPMGGYPVQITLNADGLAALNAARGGRIAFGGSITTAGGSLRESVFGRSDADTYTGITLTTVPEPASLALPGLGAAGVWAYGWRRREACRQRRGRYSTAQRTASVATPG